MIVFGQRVVDFVEGVLGREITPPFTAIGRERDGEVVAGVVFNCFARPDIEITVAAARGAMTRGFLAACGRYVFDQIGCLRASITTESPEIAELARRLGAQTEGRKRDAFGKGRDAILLGIMKEDWKIR